MTDNLIRVRFAPSPTGYLHLGSLRVALFNWLYARHNKGQFIIRIEDTDLNRSESKYVDSILIPLKWVGIESDEPITFQSQRLELYNKVLNYMLEKNLAYRCFCSEKESNQNVEYKKYEGTCRNRLINQIDLQSPHVIRFKLPENIDKIEFNDLIRGDITFDIDQFDDFVIFRSDGMPTYNFAVVVDDNSMNITHILRGEEHISNTPKQILLYQACGFRVPLFGHLPLILSPDGGKLSKRHAATSVDFYQKEGFLPDALCNYLVRLGWAHGDQEIFSKEEMIKYFTLENVSKHGAIFDIKKLEWVNGVYIRNSSSQYLFDYITENIDADVFKNLNHWSQDKILKSIDLYKDRVRTLKELLLFIVELYNEPHNLELHNLDQWANENSISILKKLISSLDMQDNFSHENISLDIKILCKEFGIKLPEIAQPIRLALTGKVSSPGIFDIIILLGKKESIQRIKVFVEFLSNVVRKH